MFDFAEPARLAIETMGESGGHCACCGNESRCVWGMVYHDGTATAAYWMHWTVGHLADKGANLDLVIGRWDHAAGPDDCVGISLLHREQPDGSPALMVIDANERAERFGSLAGSALSRQEVIGTPLAPQVFSIVDAIYEQDGRFF